MEITTYLSKAEIAKEIVEILEGYYTKGMMSIHIGLTSEGLVDYAFDIHRSKSCVKLVLATTRDGWCFGDWDGDIDDEDSWTDEQKSALADTFEEWIGDAISAQDDVEVEFA